MVEFNDLPIEIIPVITRQLLRPHHLATASLVNRSFYTYTIPLLYERASIFAWHRESKVKASRLVAYCTTGHANYRFLRRLNSSGHLQLVLTSPDTSGNWVLLCTLINFKRLFLTNRYRAAGLSTIYTT